MRAVAPMNAATHEATTVPMEMVVLVFEAAEGAGGGEDGEVVGVTGCCESEPVRGMTGVEVMARAGAVWVKVAVEAETSKAREAAVEVSVEAVMASLRMPTPDGTERGSLRGPRRTPIGI